MTEYQLIGQEHLKLREKLARMKREGATLEVQIKLAKAIQICWECYQKAKFGKVKTRLTVAGILRDSYL